MVKTLLKFAAIIGAATAAEQHNAVMANPVRKVVNLLQAMQKKVEEEGKQEKDLYEKFMCYCKTGGGDLAASIAAAEDKGPSVSSNIEASEASLTQAKEDLKQAQSDRSAAKAAIEEATALREKEAASFAAYKADADTNIAAITKAVTALENGMAGGFLQTDAAAVLKRVVDKSDMVDADQQEVIAFLSGGNGYAPSSGEITGILKQMGDTMAANLADAVTTEDNSLKTYDALVAAKQKEIAATTATVEAKTKQIGELGVAIVQMKEDLSDTQAGLMEDQKFLAQLEKGCKSKTGEWEERSKTRAEEMVALADTIKILNDDDALELFKKTLPSPGSSFVQVSVTSDALRSSALATIKAAGANADKSDKAGLQFLALALSGKKSANAGGFDKVLKMIDNMVDVLGKEQNDDNDQKEYCQTQLDTTDDKTKALSRTLEQTGNVIETSKEGISTLTEEIAALEAGIKALDTSVADATEQRREDNAEFKSLVASDTAAKELLSFAKNRLNKFYNPSLHKAAPKTELSRGDRIYENEGGEIATAAPGGIANTGITAFVQVSSRDAPAPPPATWNAYAKKGGESTGVISMIDLLISDLEKELTEATTEEKNDQSQYEATMADASEKRTVDSESLTGKSAAKADLEAELQKSEEHKKATTAELMATEKYMASLHAECDWLLQNFDVRKEARAGEVDSLKKAKAVLSGADYSFLQMRRQGNLRRAF